MQLSEEQFALVEHLLPVQRGNVRIENLTFLNAILYVAMNGCTWRGLPKEYGRWHTVYTRMRRWAENGVLDKVFEELQLLNILKVKVEVVSMDSTNIKVHPDGTGALKTGGRKLSGEAGAVSTPSFIWLPRASSKSSASP